MDNDKKERRIKKMIGVINSLYPECNVGEFKEVLQWDDNAIVAHTTKGQIILDPILNHDQLNHFKIIQAVPKMLSTFEELNKDNVTKRKIFTGLGYDAQASINNLYSQMDTFLEKGKYTEESRQILSTTTDGAVYTSVGELKYKEI